MQRVFVTGIGAVSPNGLGREEFWRNTRDGVSGVRAITRFDCSGQPVRIAGEIVGFDPLKHMDARELDGTGLATPYAIAAAGEALEDARLDWRGMDLEALRRVSVYTGSGGGNQEFTERQYSLYYSGQQKKCSVYVIPSSTLGTLASEISMRYGFRGLSHMFSNGCTSSTDAIGYAYRAVKHGEAEIAVCGGVDAPIAPLTLRGFQLLRIMSTGRNETPGEASRPLAGTGTDLCWLKGRGSLCWRARRARGRAARRFMGKLAGMARRAKRFTGCGWRR